MLGTRANLKGFACEYMTSGRVVILGDPGPYAFAGMTGGVVYQQLSPELGLDERAFAPPLGPGREGRHPAAGGRGNRVIAELLAAYITALEPTDHSTPPTASTRSTDLGCLQQRFVKIVPA